MTARTAPPARVEIEPDGRGWSRYVITSGRFRAVLPRCERDECASGQLTECRVKVDARGEHDINGRFSVDRWLSHCATHCHGWHADRVADFVAIVDKTYGSHKPATDARLRASLKARRAPVSGGAETFVAEQLGITVDEYRAELAKAAL